MFLHAHALLESISGSGITTVQVVLAALGSGGLIGAVVALLKLRPDANTAAVTQSQGAMETMAILNKQLEDERNEWRARALGAEHELAELRRAGWTHSQ